MNIDWQENVRDATSLSHFQPSEDSCKKYKSKQPQQKKSQPLPPPKAIFDRNLKVYVNSNKFKYSILEVL